MAQPAATVWRLVLVFVICMVACTLPPPRALAVSTKVSEPLCLARYRHAAPSCMGRIAAAQVTVRIDTYGA